MPPLSTETRDHIFSCIKEVMAKYVPPMVVSKEKSGVYELMGNKPVPYGSKKVIVPGMYFSSIVARKDMISFYFFPIYYQTEEFIGLIPTVSKCLKGKTCFNFKKPEQVNVKELNALLKKGVAAWKKLGYMK
ncbi:MAG: hypothetical protein IPI66_14365 [Chitinophagaceae bacterium]|nr:hypothetical protein [Chitinophagaceae bacterium]MBL0056855.1 hypothetical protein [Chitinophagaceae bacterium]